MATDTPAPPAATALTRDAAVTLDRAALSARAEGDDRIPIAFSSEQPVERYDWRSGETYLEVLDHAEGSIDLTRAADGLPFLFNHYGDQIGIVEDVALGADRMLRGTVRFSRNARAQEIRQDMLDGIRRSVSVGYSPGDDYEQTKDKAGKTVRRYRRWAPYEASSVPIPADPTVGVGRAAPTPPPAHAPPHVPPHAPSLPHGAPPAAQAKESRMSAVDTAAEPAATGTTVTREAPAGATPAQLREQAINNIAEAAGASAEQARAWRESEKTIRAISDEAFALVRGAHQDPTPRVSLTAREEQEYSFRRAILSQTDGSACFERDVSEQIGRNLPQGYKPQGGMYVLTGVRNLFPAGVAAAAVRHLMQRAGLDSAAAGKGAEVKFTQAGAFIDLLRNAARVIQAGATMLPGLDGPVTFPKQNGAGTVSWMGENAGADVAESNLTLGTVSLTAKTMQSTTSFSRQLLRQAVVDVEALVRADIAAIHGLEIDRVAINGSGASNQPTGILNQAGVGVVAIGANGGAPTYAHAVALGVMVETANAADLGAASFITTPGVKGTYKLTQKFAGTNGAPVWGDDNTVAGMTAYSTNQAPANLAKGTGTNMHAGVAGVFSQLLIGEFGAMEILTDPYRLKKQGMIEVTSFQMIDLAVRYAQAFAAFKDAVSQF